MFKRTVALSLLLAAPAAARDTWTAPYRGVRVLDRTTADPNRIHAAVVDLCAPGVSVHVTRPQDRGITTSRFAALYDAPVAVNGGFHNTGNFATIGLTVGDGIRWPDGADDGVFGFAAFSGANRAGISVPADLVASPAWWMREVVSGKPLLVDHGQVVHEPCALHFCQLEPRTAVGLDATGRQLILATVDGRLPGVSVGMDRETLAQLMIDLGADRALNLDGGGSTTFVVGGAVVNTPSDGAERAVANHLGIGFDASATIGHCCDVRPVDGDHGHFVDLPADHWGRQAAEALWQAGITEGCQADPPAFCPDCGVPRRDAAVMVARALHLPDRVPGAPSFADVPLDAPGAGAIEALFAAGMVAGCADNPRRFCPDDLLDRAVAVVLVARAAALPPGDAPPFADVPADAWYADAVQAAAAACVVSGCRAEPREFCPDQELTRIQLASMLARAFRLGGLGGCGGPPDPMPDAAVPDASPADAAVPDAAVADAARPDALRPDASVPDALASDASARDALAPDARARDAQPAASDARVPDAAAFVVDGEVAFPPRPDAAPATATGEPAGCACDQTAAPLSPWLLVPLALFRRRRRA